MERIDAKKPSQHKPIPALNDGGEAPQPAQKAGCDTPNGHWLSSAMAIWIQTHEDAPPAPRQSRVPSGH